MNKLFVFNSYLTSDLMEEKDRKSITP